MFTILRWLEKIKPKKFRTYPQRVAYYSRYYNKGILNAELGNAKILQALENPRSLMVSRLGSIELNCLQYFLRRRQRRKPSYPDSIKKMLSNNAGVFPVTDHFLDRFAESYLTHIKNADIMGVWGMWLKSIFLDQEDCLLNEFCPKAVFVDPGSLEPFRFKEPWSSRLENRKVLVVHPFAKSIMKQYQTNRTKLFKNPAILPEFHLTVIPAVQSIANTPVPFQDWLEALDYMCGQIERTDFDVCLIGAGAYGLPLASFVKSIGKAAIHMGGVTQILFGVKGRRWEEEYKNLTAKMFNEYWVRPDESEIPENYKQVEGGCYW